MRINKNIIISLGSLLVSAILFFVLLLPLFSSINKTRSDLAQKQREKEKIQELLDKVEQLKKEYQRVKDKADLVLSSLPKEQDIAYLLVQFDNLAVRNGMLLDSINISDISDVDLSSQEKSAIEASGPLSGFRSSQVDLSISGSYESFKNYLNDIEKNIRAMSVDSINFSAGGEIEEDLSYLDFSIKVFIYYR